eukprot:TRINITY_DN26932_c0_g7_i2.p1 TRINITY_DN26932_c0_g7~~TRINITY_DN26932_c0_g7_i2.p1  ORF type:complete len:1687 (-),score=268.18 TRINITY_DN26932_c0_g7_i2:111-5171(-)
MALVSDGQPQRIASGPHGAAGGAAASGGSKPLHEQRRRRRWRRVEGWRGCATVMLPSSLALLGAALLLPAGAGAAAVAVQQQQSLMRSEATAATARRSFEGRTHAFADGAGAVWVQARTNVTAGGALGVKSAASINPMVACTLDDSNQWLPWDGLEREITVFEDCVVIAQYQISMWGSDTHLFSRLFIDSGEVPSSRSGQGNNRFAANFGFYVGLMRKGNHDFKVEYRTDKKSMFKKDGGQWQTRALNVLTVPEASSLSLAPRWAFKISSSGIWGTVPGLEQEVELVQQMNVLVFYSFLFNGELSFAAARLLRNGMEKRSSRSVAGHTKYNQLFGFYVDTLAAGKHRWTVEYKSEATDSFFEENDWMSRSLTIVKLPNSIIHTVYDASEFATEGDGILHPWKGLTKTIKLEKPKYIIATYSIAWTCNEPPDVKKGDLFSVLLLNGAEQKQTRSRAGVTEYCQNTGMWMGELDEGEHTFEVHYKASAVLTMPEYLHDWGNRALNLIELSLLDEVDQEEAKKRVKVLDEAASNVAYGAADAIAAAGDGAGAGEAQGGEGGGGADNATKKTSGRKSGTAAKKKKKPKPKPPAGWEGPWPPCKDTWQTKYGSSPEQRCQLWAKDRHEGALKDNKTFLQGCNTKFARENCALTCGCQEVVKEYVPTTAPGIFLTKWGNARDIVLTSATMSGGYVTNGEHAEVSVKANSTGSNESRSWLVSVLDDENIKVVQLKVHKEKDSLYLLGVRAGYQPGYGNFKGNVSTQANLVLATSVESNIVQGPSDPGFAVDSLAWKVCPHGKCPAPSIIPADLPEAFAASRTIALWNPTVKRFIRMATGDNIERSEVRDDGTLPPNQWLWDRFKLIYGGRGEFGFWNIAHRRYLRLQKGQDQLDKSGEQDDDKMPDDYKWERFMPIPVEDGVIALWSKTHKRFVQMSSSDNFVIRTDEATQPLLPKDWNLAKFKVVPAEALIPVTYIALWNPKTERFFQMGTENKLGFTEKCPNATMPDNATGVRFKVVDGGEGSVGLWSPKYKRFVKAMAVDNLGRSDKKLDGNLPKEWTSERFSVVNAGEGLVGLQSLRFKTFASMGKTCLIKTDESEDQYLPSEWSNAKFQIVKLEAPTEAPSPAPTPAPTPACRWDCYLNRYKDVRDQFGWDLEKAEIHFANQGEKEGRTCSCPVCNWQCYLNRYEELREKKFDLEQAQHHYNQYGIKEGKDCTCGPVCNWECYLQRYGDLRKQKFNAGQAENHYKKIGIKEGRDCTCPECNYQCYLNRYDDLRHAKFDLKQAEEHYNGQGMQEGRDCTCGPGGEACNWQCYLQRYEELRKAGMDVAKAEEHYKNHGMKEGRDCSCKEWFCVTRGSNDQVVGPFKTLLGARTELNKQEGTSQNKQMVCEMNGVGAKKDPHEVGGIAQEVKAGFNTFWKDWTDIRTMNKMCEDDARCKEGPVDTALMTYVMQGNGKGDKKELPENGLANVRCCNGDKVEDSARLMMSKYYGQNSDCEGCCVKLEDQTYADALAICKEKKYDLCTEEQLAGEVAAGTGCGYDVKDVWVKRREANRTAFHLKNVESGRCVHTQSQTAKKGGKMVYWEGCDAEKDQFWKIKANGNAFYLQNVQTGLCVHTKGDDADGSTIVFGAGCNDKKNQFLTVAAGDGAFYLKNAESGYCLHTNGTAATNGGRMVFRSGCTGEKNKFMME